ncbi:hypothetical protein TI39_contig4283g00008 [Zymoseptoria brevis]|uniref:Uncharacterized protein n=1 Tax=Zymoseptoria brevis TaxID=1047168 RepID=A0A0F4G899_9PEZI|nr:hypothetical protein TI39_contig4283g00008 [Zymoseptoria brevis]
MPPFLSLASLATRCETAASGLEVFRPHLPLTPSRPIASLFSDPYALSSVLQTISSLANPHTYGPSFWRIAADLDQGRRALQATLDDVHDVSVVRRSSASSGAATGSPAHPLRDKHVSVFLVLHSAGSSRSMSSIAHTLPTLRLLPSTPPLDNPFTDNTLPANALLPDPSIVSPSQLYAAHDTSAISRLRHHGFHPTLTFSFNQHCLTATLYHRPIDHHAQVVIQTPHLTHQPSTSAHETLTNLRLIRRGSLLHLCHFDPWVDETGRDGEVRYEVWTTLNFLSHERILLFYSCFVAMKAQDQSSRAVRAGEEAMTDELRDGRALESGRRGISGGPPADERMEDAEDGEAVLFDATIVRAVRLEATPLRGSRTDVPLWTKFIDLADARNWIKRFETRVGLIGGRGDDGGVVGFVDVDSGALPEEWSGRAARRGIEL